MSVVAWGASVPALPRGTHHGTIWGMTKAWAEFSRETFGDPYMVWHDGADFQLLLTRWQDEPGVISEMLQLGLSEADPVAAQAIGVLAGEAGDVSELAGLLREVLPRARGTFRVRVAQALFALRHDQDLAGPICEVLIGGGFWSEKIDAAIALNAFAPAMAVVQALAQGVQDKEYLVRRHSAQTLLTLAGRHTTIEKVPDLWARIRKDREPAAWRHAAAELAMPWTG